MDNGERKKGSESSPAARRAARLAAELRANLKKRKEQAKVRARVTVAGDDDAATPDQAARGEAGD